MFSALHSCPHGCQWSDLGQLTCVRNEHDVFIPCHQLALARCAAHDQALYAMLQSKRAWSASAAKPGGAFHLQCLGGKKRLAPT